jgi:CBS domain-containing protein
MTHLLVVILNDLSHLPALMKAWRQLGVPGVTILHSLGGFRAESWLQRIGFSGLGWLLDSSVYGQRTLLSLIDDEDLLEKAIDKADLVVGGFDSPHSGILFTIPIGRTIGLQKWNQKSRLPEKLPADKILKVEPQVLDGQTRVADLADILRLAPAVVKSTASLSEVVDQFLSHPSVQVVCVVNEQEHLVGLIDMMTLANTLLLTVFPEEFLDDLKGLENVLNLAHRARNRTAGEIMIEPAYLQLQDSLQTAFHLLHRRKLPGLPVVDPHYHITGYISLLELLVVCLRSGKDMGGSSKASP